MASVQWDREDVTIVMVASPPAPEAPPQATIKAVDRSTSGRFNIAPVQSPLAPCPSPEGRGERAAPKLAPQPAFPPLTAQAANLFEAAVAFVGDGCAMVDEAEYRQRLETCRTCDRRLGKRCTACGCWINVKARGRAFLTNAGNVTELGGPFDTFNFNLGVGPVKGSVQIGVSGGTWIGSITVGPGAGADVSVYPTSAITTR